MFIVDILGNLMRIFYNLFHNYGLAILLFTLFSKIILLPISVWVQKNSIKMVKMQPSINRIKINYFGDKDKIAEEESILYHKEKYNAFASLIPLIIQIGLLLCLVEVINHPLTYLLNTPKETTQQLTNIMVEQRGSNPESSSLEIEVVKEIKKENQQNIFSTVENHEAIEEQVKNLNFNFLGFDLTWIAVVEQHLSIWVPILAGLSALFMCFAQNKINVLQQEQSNWNKYGMLIFSVGLSLYLGAFVPAGVALYWIYSNLFAVLQQWLLNLWINPKKYIDYKELETTNEELKALKEIKNKNKLTKEERKKAKNDYKRFFKVVNKHLVFYSESNGFYKYYKGIIEYLLKNTNIVIHYITSDYHDQIFDLEKENHQIKAYFIDEKRLITLMMKIDADVVVMTMPDLQTYHIKRSYLRKDIEYIYIPHGMDSLNMTMRTGSMNYFDTIYTTGPHQYDEAIKTNEYYHLNRKIIKWGYSLLDDMLSEYKKENKNKTKQILIAPSWQKDNIIDLCLSKILEKLKDKNYDCYIRPHPQEIRRKKDKFLQMQEEYKKYPNIHFELDFSKNSTVFNADLLITDWSGIAFEYAFTTKKPVVFIDTPMKVMNPEYKNIKVEPFNIWARKELGEIVKVEEINTIDQKIDYIINHYKEYQAKINKLTKESTYNLGISGKVGAEYIIETIQKKIEERRNEK